MGSFAGAPYLSANADNALVYTETLALAAAGLIDPVQNMERASVYIYQGLLDTITGWGAQILCDHSRILSNHSVQHKEAEWQISTVTTCQMTT